MRMVERVARAIHDAECTCGTWREPATKEQMSTFFAPFSKTHYHSEDSIEGWVEVARAAIEAMREPTEAMLEIGGDTSIEEGEHIDERKAWRRMIDAALSD